MTERITLTTTDGIEIVGTYYPANADRFALLLHMRPATKESWERWARLLQERGFSCLAIDQRGHGESTMNGTLNYETFGDEESRGKRHDVEAAFTWLKDRGATEETTVLIGASIGANLAIRFLAEHPAASHAVALSPGVSFRGVSTDDVITRLQPHQRVILVASDDDPHGSFESARTLHALAPERTILLERSGLGHGTTMLEQDPSLFETILTHLS